MTREAAYLLEDLRERVGQLSDWSHMVAGDHVECRCYLCMRARLTVKLDRLEDVVRRSEQAAFDAGYENCLGRVR